MKIEHFLIYTYVKYPPPMDQKVIGFSLLHLARLPLGGEPKLHNSLLFLLYNWIVLWYMDG